VHLLGSMLIKFGIFGDAIGGLRVRVSRPVELFSWDGPLASLSIQTASVTSKHHSKNNGRHSQ